jgi:hypothetical protein
VEQLLIVHPHQDTRGAELVWNSQGGFWDICPIIFLNIKMQEKGQILVFSIENHRHEQKERSPMPHRLMWKDAFQLREAF